MLKKIWLLSFLLLSVFSFVFAQSGEISDQKDIINENAKPSVVKESQNRWANYDYINDIEVRFCNKWLKNELLTKTDLIMINADEKKDICVVFFNRWDKTLEVYYGYGSANISPNNGLPMCNDDLWTGKFGSMIAISEKNFFTITPGSNIIKNDMLFLPPWVSSWLIHWCINFGIKKDVVADPNAMFVVQTRKSAGLDILIDGVASLKNGLTLEYQKIDKFITNKKIKASMNDNDELILSLLVKNQWNVDQIVSMSGEINNFLWYQKKFVIDSQIVGAYQTLELTQVIDTLPAYKGIFTVEMKVDHKPSFIVDVSSLSEDKKMWGSFYETWKLFIFSWQFLWAILLLLLVFVRLIKSFIRK